MMILNGVEFPLCTDSNDPIGTHFYIHESDNEDGTIAIGLDASFARNTLDGEEIKPSFDIGFFETGKTEISELVGLVFEVNSVKDSLEREDMFYVWEHEPFEKLRLEIVNLDMGEEKIHVKCEGIAVIDGYSDPYETATFTFESWIPISSIE